MEKNQVAV